MTQSTTNQSIKTLDISELKSLDSYHSYLVKRSDEPTCIYKLLENCDGLDIIVSFEHRNERSFLGIYTHGKTPKGSLQNGPANYNYFNDRIIHLTAVNADLKPFKRDNYNNVIQINDFPLSIQTRSKKYPLVEKDGSYYLNAYGCLFKAEEFDRNLIRNDLLNVLQCMLNSSIEFIDREQRVRYLQYLCNISSNVLSHRVLPLKTEGITKTVANTVEFWQNEKDFLSAVTYYIAATNSKLTISGVKMSVVFNKIFESVASQEEFSRKTLEMSEILLKETYMYDYKNFLTNLLDYIPEARDIKKAALKRKSTGAFSKIMDDLDFVDIDKEKYPLTHEAVHSGDIPLGCFFRKTGESYFIFNDNWELWEEMLAAHPDVAKQIGATCSGRTTYEKDIMSYFYCVLHKLPDYLEKHTGKKWKCIPKLVNSSNELDPPKEGSNGVAKTRSALTPIVDNEKNEVVIPYVSMQVSGGYGTTYCYGLDYNVLDRGMSWLGNTVTKSIESKLNGRDDYGLMFYTLTGTAQGRGYPTFLIIFERLEKSTRVHFHRVHPTRSKGGEYNSIHNWTKGCYKWMIGNVNFDRIKAQQGDLAFVEIDNFPTSAVASITQVNSYDSHMFENSVTFAPYEKKDNQNVLGYVQLMKDTKLNHTEHMERIIPAGTYEIRQCRSWEANPKGVWSLRID